MLLSVLWIDAAAPVRKQTCVKGELSPVSWQRLSWALSPVNTQVFGFGAQK